MNRPRPNEAKPLPMLVWMDLEMTGLNPEVDTVLESAVLVTDLELTLLAEGPVGIVGHSPAAFNRMDAWNQKHHTQSGLWEKACQSRRTVAELEEEILVFLKPLVAERAGILAGNSIWQDRRFIVKYMPRLHAYLHYRMVDVSSIKTLVAAWYPALRFRKNETHRAVEDIHESIDELRYYRSHCFVPKLP